ncbi:MAG: molybdate ABC transporter substrate-binding protein [Ignavibacteria bacterium]|nr:molybdate ABC transporter substrate-binding protein [Ignavibacteria bacterium]
MKKLLLLFLLILSFNLNAQTVKIAAAANLNFAIEEIKTKYESQNPGTKVVVSLGSSGTLYQQITNGAEFDIFMAADKKFPQKLKEENFVSGEVRTYVLGKLVLWSNMVDVSKGIEILADKPVNRVSIAKPELAPYGDRALQCLKHYNLFEKVKDKIVYADNISQAAQFAQTGNAEAAFIALSLAIAPEMKGNYFELDPKSYTPIEQALILLKTGQDNPEAAKFLKFVFSSECKAIFEKYGYLVP